PTINTGTSVILGTHFALSVAAVIDRRHSIISTPSAVIDRRYRTNSEQQLRRELQLPRIEHRSGSTEKRIRNGRPSRGTTADLNCLDRAACRVLVLAGLLPATEIVSAVDANDLVHIRTVEQVEGIDGEFEPGSLLKIDRAREADVPRLKAVALVRIACEIPNAIGGGDEVVVGI